MKTFAELINKPIQSEVSKKMTSQSLDDTLESRIKSDVPGVTKKIQKFSRKQYQDAKLTSIGIPKRLTPTEHCKRRYSVRVGFTDLRTGKAREKLVQFGREGKLAYVDHHDLIKRENSVSKLKHTENFLHHNFYDKHVMNGEHETVLDNYMYLVGRLKLV